MDEAFYEQLVEVVRSPALIPVGDFNFPDICWKYNMAQRKQSKRFLECVEDSFLTQLVREPTRGGALLDLLFANREGLVGDVKVGDCLGQSDHEIVEFSILGDVRRVTTKTAILNFQRADSDLLRTLVARVPWESLLKGKGVQEAWTLLKVEILKAQNQAVPEYRKASRRGRRPVWMSRELLSRLRKKKRVYVLWKRGQAGRGDYKEVAKVCREEVRKAKAHLELRLATAVKQNKKSFYKYINGKRKTKDNLYPLIDAAGHVTTDDKEKAEVLNAFFTSAFNSQTSYLQGTLCPDLDIWADMQHVSPEIEVETVRELLLHLDNHNPWDRMGFILGC
ncbi:uncharacterized protein LOC122188845 [Lagopus leucura]|uniref:uncharacterized protein LOC122188845 n=1 Tax=Lagopus leucura TaxID=30410 RepID=UPI001C675D26|nr:uncharacterized protein LOC122188845 [Lagopus leucura]